MSKTATSVWTECLSFIQDNIKQQAYKTWFEPIKPIKLSGEALTIQVPSKFFYEWLEEHYVKILKVLIITLLILSVFIVVYINRGFFKKSGRTRTVP